MNLLPSVFLKPETHRILYILLLIATPFLLLQNYLQSLIGEFSNLTYSLFGLEIPVTVSIAVVLAITILGYTYKKLNRVRIMAWLFVLLLFWVGQKSTDFYFNHKFYELQYNWHYFAYAIFAYLNYRVLIKKKVADEKIILFTFLSALATSTIDELLQMPLSNRIFDMGDISKDLWGSVIGLIVIYFVLDNGRIAALGWKFRHKTLKEYFQHPMSMLFLALVLAYIFMVVTALLTLTEFIAVSIFISLFVFLFLFSLFHLSQIRLWKRSFIMIALIGLGLQTYFFLSHDKQAILKQNNSTISYKNLPLVYFDVLIYPNGMFRLVDKKTSFNKRDQQTIFNMAEHIVIIGSGKDGEGGKGFPQEKEVQFIYDGNTMEGIQLIIQESDKACKTFNRLSVEGKRPLLILHND